MKKQLLSLLVCLMAVTSMQAQNLWDIISGDEQYSTLTLLIEEAGLVGVFDTSDPVDFTVWAPNDDAFADLDPALVNDLLADPTGILTDVLLYHVLPQTVLSSGLADGISASTLLGLPVEITENGGNFFVNSSQIIAPIDQQGEFGGVVHTLDAVLLPPDVCIDFLLVIDNDITDAPVSEGGLCTTVQSTFPVWAGDLYQTAGYVAGVTYVASICEGPGAGSWDPELSVFTEDGELIATVEGCELVFEVPEDGTYLLGVSENGVCTDTENDQTNNGILTITCTSDDVSTIFSVVEESEIHNTLQAALEASGLDAVLSQPGAFTLFAPTDEAFTALGGVVADLLLDPTGALANVLLHHVVDGVALSSSLSDGQEIITIQGETITISIVGGDVFVNGAQVIQADIETANGVVHVIDAVLVPEFCTAITGTVTNFINAGGAPAPDANGECPVVEFTAFGVWPGEAYPVDNIVAGTEYTFDICDGFGAGSWPASLLVQNIVTGAIIAAVDGCTITWTAETNDDIRIIIHEQGTCGNQSTNTQVDNGSPSLTCTGTATPATVVDIIVNSPDHETLEDLVIAANLAGVLSGEGPFTVFAPTDAAFDNVDPATLAALAADPFGLLTQVLTYHVAPLEALSTSLSDGQSVPTVNGEPLTIGVGATVTVGNAAVTATVTGPDLIADNGVVHVIDAVLIPVTLNTDNVDGLENLVVFPNPTADQFTVDINLSQSHRVTIDLVNLVGQNVRSFDLGQRSNGLTRQFIDVEGLANGFYLMNITVGDSQVVTKVQVQK